MIFVLVVSILGQTLLAADDAGVVVQWYLIRAHLETDLVILQAKEIGPQTMTPGVGSACLGSRQFCYRCSPGFLLTNTRPSLAQSKTGSHQKIYHVSIPPSNELWFDTAGVTNDNNLETVEYTL
ncbi:hypothetical protein TNCV_736041 [Trichonephila clavipes]|uniref:Uncharacterized protein n=1 Tax=Trichonephila clavipes TaxID=2585209 RepID=A0A8X6SMP0_TRICX|nr:hypothetical protein TNCV_736041 [Trichonephila clavipes]